ncbi:hypothetical protein AYO20_07660 [Fonsecaea nubica]|uniref:Uncharacterized protein n=1 Tax=Fonsecaea nubica TaxID=856822 RepID=A0A178CSQ7_9EURO|nr:hypothetical protein AYO20_07660 [Fonsecaea nubica]OAL32869.1 hypothetical protein AYO20_07660 [Fonsecaea nubica]
MAFRIMKRPIVKQEPSAPAGPHPKNPIPRDQIPEARTHDRLGPPTQPANHHAPRATERIVGQPKSYAGGGGGGRQTLRNDGTHLGYDPQPSSTLRRDLDMAEESLSVKHTELQQHMLSWARYYHDRIPWAEGWMADRWSERFEEDRWRAERIFCEDEDKRLAREKFDRETSLQRSERDWDVLLDRYEEDRRQLSEMRRLVEEDE